MTPVVLHANNSFAEGPLSVIATFRTMNIINRVLKTIIVSAFLLSAGTLSVFAQATQVRIETASNGSGTVVPAQNLTAGNSKTVYAISRTAGGSFVSNIAADSIRLVNETGQVIESDLVVAGNRRSAVLTGRGVGTLQIRAYSGSLTSVNSGTVTVVPGAANKLRIATEPSDSAMAGVAFAQQPVIRIEDSFGNLVTNHSTTVITAARVNGSGTLQGTLTKTASGGIATFTNLFHTVATTISLRFTSSPSLTPDTSTNVVVDPAPASKFLFVQQPTNEIAGAVISPAITVRLRDAFDNNVLTSGVSIMLSLTTGTGVLSGTSTQSTNASGISTFSDLSINLSGSKRLTASSVDLTSLLSSTFTITAGSARQLSIQTQPSGNATAGVAFAQQPVLGILDSLGNLVTTDNSTVVTATRLLGSGALQGTTTATASGGIATFLNLSHRVADTINIRFTTTSPVLTPDTSNTIIVNAAAASKVVFGQQPTNTSAGATITPPVTVQLQDFYSNPVSTSGIAVVMALTSGTGSLSGTKNRTTDSTGQATFNDLSINLVGTKVLTASSTSLTSAVSNSFSIASGIPASVVTTAGTPQSTGVNRVFGTNLQATVRDAGGNLVSGAVVVFTQPGSGASGNFAGGVNTATTNASGVATAAAFTANTTVGSYTVPATVSGVATPANFLLTNNPGSAATITATAGTPQSTQVGTAFGTNLQASVRDSFSNLVPGVVVAFNKPGSGASGTFAGGINTATTDSTGHATAPTFTANTSAGTYAVSATAGVASAATFSLTNTAGPAASITSTAGTPQSTQVGSAFAVLFQATVKDASNNPVNGATVTFTAPSSGASGTFSSGLNTAITNANGIATAQAFTANTTAGSYTVGATVGGVATPANFSLTNTPGTPASIIASAGTPQTVQVGGAFAVNLQATVRDSSGNLVNGAVVTFTGPTTGARGTFASGSNTTTATTNASGVATASVFTANTVSGSYTVTGTVGVVGTPANYILTNSPGSAASVAATAGTPQSTQISTAFPVNFQVVVHDAFGNTVPNTIVNFTPPPSGATGTFAGGNTATTNSSGVATANVFVANFVAGSYTVNAMVGGVAAPAPFALTNTPGTSASVSTTAGSPQSAQVGTAFTTNLQATVRDGANNPIPDVTVTFTAPSTGPSGTFVGNLSTINVNTNSSGVATATVFTANTTAGSYTVGATVSGVATPANFSLTNSTGPPGSITVTAGTPQSATVNTAFSINLQVLVKDAANNPVPGATVTFNRPESGASGTFAGNNNLAVTNGSGIATAQVFTANTIAGSYQIMASAPGVATPATFNLTNNPGLASTIAPIGGTPQSTQINSAFATSLQARVRDAAGNAVPNVTVNFTAPSSGASGTFQGGLISFQGQTDSNGIASATTFTANATAGAYLVTGTVDGVAAPAQFELTNTSAAAASITITQGNSQNTQVGTTFATALQAIVRDALNNPVPGALVTFTAPSTSASGTFTNGLNTLSVNTNATGLATATAFTANNSAGSYNVSATVAGVPIPAQFALTNNPGPASVVLSSAGTPQNTTVNTGFATDLQATVRDGFGNPVPGITVIFIAPASAASGFFAGGSGTFSGQTNASGVLSTPQFRANTTAGSYSVTASVPGVPTPATYALTNTPGITASVLITAGGTQSTVVGTQFPIPIQIVVRDSFSNPIPNVSVAMGSPSSGASCSFNPNPATTNSNGVAQTVAIAGTISGSYIGTATVSGITPSPISLRNLPASQKRIITVAGTPQSAQVGTVYLTALQTTVRDTFDNPIPNLTVTYTAPQSGATGTFSGGLSTAQVQTDSIGRASAPTFTANTTPGTFNVSAGVSGIATSALFVLTNLTGPPGNISATQGTPQNAVVRTPFATRFKAVVRDAANNPLSGVVVSFSHPAAGPSGTFVGDSTAITDVNGVAEANIFTANTIAGNYNIIASAPGVSNPALYSLTNLPGSANTVLASAGTSQAAQIGIPFAIPLRATVKDTFGNLVAGVRVRFVRPSSGASCNFAGNIDTARTEANGVATSPTFVANLIAGSYTVSGTVVGVGSPANFELTNTAAQPGGITVTAGNGQTAQINTPFAVQLAAMVRDAANNPVPDVEVTFTPPTTGAGGTFRSANNRAMTNSGGVATADSFFANTIAGAYEVVATAPGVSQPARFNLTNIPSAAASISALGGTPQAAQVNTAFVTRFRVGVRDGANNPVGNILVTFTKPGSGASGSFLSNINTATTNDSGFAIAQPFTANGIAGNYIVSAGVQGVSVPAEFQLVNTTGAPGTISVFSGGTQQATVNTAFDTTLSARVVDASGNPVNNIEVIFTAPASGASGTFPNGTRTVSVMTNTTGRATAPTFTANIVAGTYEVMATALGVATPAIFILSNRPDVLNTFVLEGEFGGSIGTQLVGVPFNIRMFAKDQFNNTVTNFNGPAVMSSTGVLSTGDGITSAFGNGTLIHRLAFRKTGSNVVLSAVRSGGTELGASNTFNVNNPAPTLAGINPGTGSLLETLTLTVRGANFIDSVTTLNLGSGISLNSMTVDSASQLRANITIAANATIGQRNITVGNPTPGGGTSIGLPFIVDLPVPGAPALVGPPNASGNQRTTLLLVWSKSALSLSYHLQVSTSLSFAATVFDDSTLIDTVKTLGPPIIQNGTTYYWRVRGRNTRGAGAFAQIKSFTTIPAYPASFALSTTVAYAQRSNAGDYAANEYRIVGMPGASNTRVSSILEGTQNLDWVAYWDNGGASNNFVPFNGSLNFNFSTGRAFWILRKGPLTIFANVPTAPLDTTTNSVDVPLHSGWNLITNPFATAIPWSEVQTANSSTLSPIYKFEGSFAISSSLEPYKGYYYFKDPLSAQSVLKIPFGLFTTALTKTSQATSGWRISIELTAGGYSDNTTSFGIEAGAREELDSLEYRKPRSVGDIPSVQFFRPEWDNNFSSFATDFRPAVGDLQTWKFNAHSISREQMELSFDEVERIPSEFKAYLIDERQAKFINLREQARYRFSSPFPSIEFSIIVGREDKVQEVLNSVGPKEFSLGNNFPNPFNPTTTIPIALPQTADVVVKMYNVLGEEVRTVFSGTLNPGRYYLVWDGKDKSGSAVASGIYLSRFTTNTGKAFSGKMILMK